MSSLFNQGENHLKPDKRRAKKKLCSEMVRKKSYKKSEKKKMGRPEKTEGRKPVGWVSK